MDFFDIVYECTVLITYRLLLFKVILFEYHIWSLFPMDFEKFTLSLFACEKEYVFMIVEVLLVVFFFFTPSFGRISLLFYRIIMKNGLDSMLFSTRFSSSYMLHTPPCCLPSCDFCVSHLFSVYLIWTQVLKGTNRVYSFRLVYVCAVYAYIVCWE